MTNHNNPHLTMKNPDWDELFCHLLWDSPMPHHQESLLRAAYKEFCSDDDYSYRFCEYLKTKYSHQLENLSEQRRDDVLDHANLIEQLTLAKNQYKMMQEKLLQHDYDD